MNIDNISMLATSSTQSIHTFLKSRSRNDLNQASCNIDEFLVVTKGRDKAAFVKARKQLCIIYNTLKGIRDCDNKKQYYRVLTEYEPVIVQKCIEFTSLCTLALESATLTNLVSGINDEDIKEQKLLEAKEKMWNERDYKTITSYVGTIKKLPTSTKEDSILLTKCPVIPKFTKAVFDLEQGLVKSSIAFDKLDFYYILKNQILLAFDSRVPNREKYVEFLLESVNANNKTGYVLISEYYLRHPNPSAFVSFAWVIDRPTYVNMTWALRNFSVQSWSLPEKYTAYD